MITMKQSTNTPKVLVALLVLVTCSLFSLSSYHWYASNIATKTYAYVLPVVEKVNSDKDLLYPHHQEIKSVLVNETFPSFANTHPIQPKETDDLNVSEYINRETVIESTQQNANQPAYLVIAGAYTDELFVISKQAQLQRIGLPAEIIQLGNSRYKKLCVGRYAERKQALALADILEEQHDISAYVYGKKPQY